MAITTKTSDGLATISLSGRFDFNLNRDFKNAYETFLDTAENPVIEIDFGNVEYIDSSALGMLLVLRDKAKEAGKDVRLVNCHGMIRQVLDIAHFERFFEIA